MITADTANGARQMVRRARKAALATLDADSGAPYASMVLVATTVGGAPLTLISGLARHTRNLLAAPAASLLIDTSNAAGDATSGGRISLMGLFVPDPSPEARGRFLAGHPEARDYADFGDFGFWRLDTASAHLIEGFGRIVPMTGAALLPPVVELAAFAAGEAAAVRELQQRWPDVTGLDPEGVDLRRGAIRARRPFDCVAATIDAALAAAANCLAD